MDDPDDPTDRGRRVSTIGRDASADAGAAVQAPNSRSASRRDVLPAEVAADDQGRARRVEAALVGRAQVGRRSSRSTVSRVPPDGR